MKIETTRRFDRQYAKLVRANPGIRPAIHKTRLFSYWNAFHLPIPRCGSKGYAEQTASTSAP